MADQQWRVGDDHEGERIDKIVVAHLPGTGRAAARRLFEQGKVRINGRRVSKGDLARAGDEITVEIPDITAKGAVPEPDAPLEVRYETDQVVVVDKPAGQATAPLEPGETGTLANALVARYPEMASIGYAEREPGLVHRLDTDTSGLVLAARTAAAFDTLSRALKERRLHKAYLLVCSEVDLADTGTIEIPIAHHPKDRRRMLACSHPRDVARNDPRPATTTFRVLERRGGLALVEALAAAAVRHQIRVHMAAIDHPLVGDALYGGTPMPGFARQALHASVIRWEGDATVPAFDVRSEKPLDLLGLLAT